MPNLKSAILSLGAALPLLKASQASIAEKMAIISGLDARETKWLKRLYANSRVEFRHSVVAELGREGMGGWQLFDHAKPLSTAERNRIYQAEAPLLSLQAAKKALRQWGGNPQEITHILFVSCTGVMAPGVQSYLQKALALSPYVNQVGLNMMGCFGAFKGLAMADAFASQQPQNRILLVCCELCSLHIQASHNAELQVGNALFGDGAAACVIGCEPKPHERVVYQMENNLSYAIPDTEKKMTWEVGDTGFTMGLKPDVPDYIFAHVAEFTANLLPPDVQRQNCHWPVHPGGKQILLAVQQALHLSDADLHASWRVLAQCGNMSSATFLFVLHYLQRQKKSRPYAVGLGFGPGLAVEGILLSTG